MNKFEISILAIIGGIETLFYIISPILLVNIWLRIYGQNMNWVNALILFIGLISTLFRAIKIGFLKE